MDRLLRAGAGIDPDDRASVVVHPVRPDPAASVADSSEEPMAAGDRPGFQIERLGVDADDVRRLTRVAREAVGDQHVAGRTGRESAGRQSPPPTTVAVPVEGSTRVSVRSPLYMSAGPFGR